MRGTLQRAWLRRGPLACVLWPFSIVFGIVAAIRRAAYRAGFLKVTRLPVPVVIVGNVTVGGSGKTPVVIALVNHLRARGLEVGVVSRGYGRSTSGCREVRADSDVREAGDEPLLIARACAVPLFVAEQRVEAAQALLRAHPRTQVIVADDGLQHYALAREIEICVFDERGIGNGWLLPAGPLRESWPRKVDLVLRNPSTPGINGFVVRREIGAVASRADGSKVRLDDLRGKDMTAIAAIARPQAFFDMLRASGLAPSREIALEDHEGFDEVTAALDTVETLVCTEKDAAKLWRVRPDAWAVPLVLEIDAGFLSGFDGLLEAKLSSAHGPETSRAAGVSRDQGTPGL